MDSTTQTVSDIIQYLDILFPPGVKGYVYCPVKDKDGKFHKEFFAWPSEKSRLIAKILLFQNQGDIYVGPALYREPGSATKAGIYFSPTAWVEFDGNYNSSIWGIVPEPTMEICSSIPGRVHCYWGLRGELSIHELERITRGASYYLRSDPSGWDSTQLLRPPGTYNSKHGVRTSLLAIRKTRYGLGDFEVILAADDLLSLSGDTGQYPDVAGVLEKYSLPIKVNRILLGGYELIPEGERSTALMEVGYLLAQTGLTVDEMMSVLLAADERIRKFYDRGDCDQRLRDIVARAKQKYPDKIAELSYTVKDPFEILESDTKVEWVWERLLQLGGTLMVSGAPSVGKSQLTLEALAHIATGSSYLGWKTQEMKVGLFSLEMGEGPLKNIFEKQLPKWTPEQKKKIKQNFKVWDRGEPLYLDTKEGQDAAEAFIKDNELRGFAIDALSSTTGEEFSSEKAAKSILDWLAKIKNRYNCFIWLVHHNRKATSENKKPNTIHDIHGAVAIAARVDTAIILWNNKKNLMFIPVKTRMSDEDQREHQLTRGANLNFTIGNKAAGPVEHFANNATPTAPKGILGLE